MDDPIAEISGVVTALCTADFNEQQKTIEKYFMPKSQFIHPFCRTPNGEGRWHVKKLYQWYRILSPHVDVKVDSVAFDKVNKILYLSIHQTFQIRFVPLYKAQPHLITKFELTHGHGEVYDDDSYAAVAARDPKQVIRARKFYIKSQEDFYQTDQIVKSVMPWFNLGSGLVRILQNLATLLCILGCFVVMLPVTFPVWIWAPIKNTQDFFGSREKLQQDVSDEKSEA